MGQEIGIADIASSGKLVAEQADEFIYLTVSENKTLAMIDTLTMKNPTRDIDFMDFGSRKLIGPSEYTAPSNTDLAEPTFTKKTLTAVEAMLPIDITLDFLEENIERDDFDGRLAGRITPLLGNDLEDQYWNGDTADANQTLKINDGFFKLAKADATVNDYDHGGVTSDLNAILYNMLLTMPSKWGDISKLVYFVPYLDEIRIRYQISQRQTSIGDFYLLENGSVSFMGIPVVGVANNFPAAYYVLTNPKNLVFGIFRGLTFDAEWVPRKRAYEYTWTLKYDNEYKVGDAIVMGWDAP